MKKILLVLSIISMAFLLGCGGGGDSKGENLKIGIIVSNFDDTFLMTVADAMGVEAEKMGGIDLELVDGKEDTANQISQVENFIIKQKDAIIVIPVDTSATDEITAKGIAAGIPIIYVNRKPDELPNGTYYVGSKEVEAGYMQAAYLKDRISAGDKVVIMMGKLDNEGALKRTEGIEEKLAEIGADVVEKQTGNWQRPQAVSLMEDWILKHGNTIKVVASNNDDMALGAIEALQASGILDDVIVLGVDATALGISSLKEGKLDATVFQNSEGQGGGAIRMAVNAINGSVSENIDWVPFELVTIDNVADYE